MGKFTFALILLILSCSNQYREYKNSNNTDSTKVNNQNNIKTYNWIDGLCEYYGKYDSIKVKFIQLKNSLDLMPSSERWTIQSKVTAWNIEDLDKLNVDSLTFEFSKKIQDLKTAELINSNYWQDLRNKKIQELTKEYELSKLTILSYKNPDTLKYFPHSSDCDKYINGLVAGKERLLKLWSELNDDMCKKNGFPENVRVKFNAEFNSKDKYKYAQIDIILFGWWNCVNSTIPRVMPDDLFDNFKVNFIELKEKCQED
jgi:hypothetical protein